MKMVSNNVTPKTEVFSSLNTGLKAFLFFGGVGFLGVFWVVVFFLTDSTN